MNKNIKKIIAFTIIYTSFSTWMPSIINIGQQCAYAYSSDEITSLKIISGVSGIPIYSSASHKNDYKITSGEKIPVVVYSKISSDKTNIKLSTINTNASDVRVFVGQNSVQLDDIYSEIQIEKGEKKSVYIRLYDSKKATDDEYAVEYQLIVERVTDDDDSELEDETVTLKDYDDIYLGRLSLFDGDKIIDFNFDKTQSIYNINIDEDISYIKIKAVPEERQNYKLIINNKQIDTKGDNKYVRDVSLDKGNNLIQIRIISSDHKRREYFLNITRGKSTTTTETTTNNSATINNENSQTMQTGWNWQYKKADGTIATGWISIGSEWYYFDSTGAMKTGWLQTNSGKWYYLMESGAMAKDSIVDGYKIGSDGVCINK